MATISQANPFDGRSGFPPSNVIGMPGISTNDSEVSLMEPRSFDEMPRVIQALRERKTVILNLTMMEPDQAQRAVDFVAGGTFAIDGHQERVGESIFLFAPSCVTVTYSFQEAASIPLTYMTAYEMLVAKAKLSKNENVLISGATSGVGTAAIKIAKSIGAKIISTVGSENKIDFAKKAGSDFDFLHNENDLYSKIKAITGYKGIHVVFEHIGKDTWQNSLKLLSKGGRIVTCGSTTGSKVSIDLQHLFYKQQSILGSTMSSINEIQMMMKFVNNNQISPYIDRVFNLDRINNAYKYIEERNQKGKIVISINDKSNTL